jgi:AbrB family looped-hinge helix DNA binding protein
MLDKKECCKIEAVVTMDVKGQIVLPKDLRERAGLNSGDKLAIVAFERDGAVCCFVMVRAETLGGTVKNMLGTIFEEALE